MYSAANKKRNTPTGTMPLEASSSHSATTTQLTRRQEPANGLHPLTAAQLDGCKAALAPHWSHYSSRDGPVMLSYATSVPSGWMLGLSAAVHGLPIVLAGLNQPRWPWWHGGRKKLPGSRRALQIIEAIGGPDRPVISSDTGDLLIGNSLTPEHMATLADLRKSQRMLVAAECNSWPVCYRDKYLMDPGHQHCLQHYDACYPNSGVLLASARTLLQFYSAWAAEIVGSSSLNKAERWNDQAAVHRLYRNRTSIASAGHFSMEVDAAAQFSLQLWKCDGPKDHGNGKHFRYCHERRNEPATGLKTAEDGGGVIYTNHRGAVQKPFLIHSNGYHRVLKANETHLHALLERYHPDRVPSALYNHPVILVDTREYGDCTVASLGWLLNRTAHQQDSSK